MAAESDRTLLREFLGLLMKPLVRYCLRNSQSIQDFIAVAKVVFIEVAQEEIRKSTEKVNSSRLSVMTGLHRKDVQRIFEHQEEPDDRPKNDIWRIIGHWEQSSDFTTKAGKPRVLTYRGAQSEFRSLVTAVTKHTDPGTILFELERIKMVERTEQGLRLIQHLPRVGRDTRRGYELLAHDIEAMINGAEENIYGPREISNLHISTEYDNIFEEDIPLIRRWLLNEGKEFHRKIRNFLSKHDADITPDRERTGRAGARVSVGSFSFTPSFPSTTSKPENDS